MPAKPGSSINFTLAQRHEDAPSPHLALGVGGEEDLEASVQEEALHLQVQQGGS